eukprot:TRINITY_DN1941_c0_g2_i2.p1 TRINITY_DN1941_c0_g2~~TRINITY_DN1941_c0_g2_i2.p1  ORF type:complete len:353 (+),score=57.70 TRINITY_DN1941_c0_g2_i2:118-1176(+)
MPKAAARPKQTPDPKPNAAFDLGALLSVAAVPATIAEKKPVRAPLKRDIKATLPADDSNSQTDSDTQERETVDRKGVKVLTSARRKNRPADSNRQAPDSSAPPRSHAARSRTSPSPSASTPDPSLVPSLPPRSHTSSSPQSLQPHLTPPSSSLSPTSTPISTPLLVRSQSQPTPTPAPPSLAHHIRYVKATLDDSTTNSHRQADLDDEEPGNEGDDEEENEAEGRKSARDSFRANRKPSRERESRESREARERDVEAERVKAQQRVAAKKKAMVDQEMLKKQEEKSKQDRRRLEKMKEQEDKEQRRAEIYAINKLMREYHEAKFQEFMDSMANQPYLPDSESGSSSESSEDS